VTDGRKRPARVLATLCLTVATTAIGGSLVAAPTYAKPDVQSVQSVQSVQARVDSLYRQAEQASERYNNARLRMTRAQTELVALRAQLARQQAKVEAVRRQVAASVIAESQGQALSATSRVLLARDPDAFLAQLSTISQFDDERTRLMTDFAVQADRLDLRRAAAERDLRSIAATKKTLGEQKAEIDTKAAAAKKLLVTLKQREAARAAARAARAARVARASRAATRAALPARVAAGPVAAAAVPASHRSAAASPTRTPTPTPTRASAPAARRPAAAVPASGRAAAAVRYAMAQIGDAYVFGAAGPSAWDCSGLTMMAWRAAGVSLPHSSSAQMGSGRRVSQSQLQPGDLVFYYSPVSHVGMYIGNGQIVNAENPSVGVKITGVNSMPYAGAVRPG
jgi:cell wall-associated NlpC family hydrolase